MEWRIVYLILSIIVMIFGIWNLAQRRSFYLALISIVWFVIVLLQFFVPNLYNTIILPYLSLGRLLTFIGIPVILLFAFMGSGFRK